MAVYDISGVQQYDCYGVNGDALNAAYDIDGEAVFPDGVLLKVMSYNVQHFTKINGQAAMQKEIVDTYAPDIIGFQEFSTTKAVPAVGQQMLVGYPYITISNHLNYNAIASKIALSDITIADYQTQDPEEWTRWGETRSYMKGYFTVGGKRICLINSHLAVLDNTVKYAQTQELFDLAEDEDYVIITADFNTNFSAIPSTDYNSTYKLFFDAGYNVLNNVPTTGITKTWSELTTAATLADLQTNPDNIITSPNIRILQRQFDTIKLDYLNGDPIDHIALMAWLQVT